MVQLFLEGTMRMVLLIQLRLSALPFFFAFKDFLPFTGARQLLMLGMAIW